MKCRVLVYLFQYTYLQEGERRMGYLEKMNESLDYIENHLDQEIDYAMVARIAGCSVNYFTRAFSIIVGLPLSEYIRRRRMTQAAFELQQGDTKVIDLAIKYGYESPDSFTRAFKKVHGIAPSHLCQGKAFIKAYSRINFHIAIKGDVEMNYRIEEKEAFRIVGIKRHFKGPEDDPRSVSPFWDEIYRNGVYRKLRTLQNGSPKGVHGFIDIRSELEVDYTIGCVTDKEAPEGMSSYVIPKSTWAIFEFQGIVQIAMEEAWKRIFGEWLPTSDYQYAETIEIECFQHEGDKRSKDCKFEIWLPVTKK